MAKPPADATAMILGELREGLTAGWPRRELVRFCEKNYAVSRRTAYRYVRKLERLVAKEGERQSLPFRRQLAQDRRDFLINQLGRRMLGIDSTDARNLPQLVALANAFAGVINEQERSAEKRAADQRQAAGPTIQVTARQTIARVAQVAQVTQQALLQPAGGCHNPQEGPPVTAQLPPARESLPANYLSHLRELAGVPQTCHNLAQTCHKAVTAEDAEHDPDESGPEA